MKLEVICQSQKDIEIAKLCNVDRIELCSALELGGMSPTIYNLDKSKKASAQIPINVLVRNRAGGFFYKTKSDIEELFETIVRTAIYKYNGIVFGALDKNNKVDFKFLDFILDSLDSLKIPANNLHWTFNRAIDLAVDWNSAIPKLINYNFDTILTSGGAKTVSKGLKQIKKMVEISNNKINIMAGGGLTIDDIAPLHKIGVKWVHTSATNFINGGGVGIANFWDNDYLQIDKNKLTLFKDKIKAVSAT
jgi:copper homeostasis protein